jgi:hypothetical protein
VRWGYSFDHYARTVENQLQAQKNDLDAIILYPNELQPVSKNISFCKKQTIFSQRSGVSMLEPEKSEVHLILKDAQILCPCLLNTVNSPKDRSNSYGAIKCSGLPYR